MRPALNNAPAFTLLLFFFFFHSFIHLSNVHNNFKDNSGRQHTTQCTVRAYTANVLKYKGIILIIVVIFIIIFFSFEKPVRFRYIYSLYNFKIQSSVLKVYNEQEVYSDTIFSKLFRSNLLSIFVLSSHKKHCIQMKVIAVAAGFIYSSHTFYFFFFTTCSSLFGKNIDERWNKHLWFKSFVKFDTVIEIYWLEK